MRRTIGLPSAGIRIGHHGGVGVLVVSQLQVVGEQDVRKGGSFLKGRKVRLIDKSASIDSLNTR